MTVLFPVNDSFMIQSAFASNCQFDIFLKYVKSYKLIKTFVPWPIDFTFDAFLEQEMKQ